MQSKPSKGQSSALKRRRSKASASTRKVRERKSRDERARRTSDHGTEPFRWFARFAAASEPQRLAEELLRAMRELQPGTRGLVAWREIASEDWTIGASVGLSEGFLQTWAQVHLAPEAVQRSITTDRPPVIWSLGDETHEQLRRAARHESIAQAASFPLVTSTHAPVAIVTLLSGPGKGLAISRAAAWIAAWGRAVADLVASARAREVLQRELDHARRTSGFPDENPSPILRVENGRVTFANAAAQALLAPTNIGVGDPVPEVFVELVSSPVRCTRELSFGGQDYLVVVIPGTEHVNLYLANISELKRAQAARSESEQRFASFMQHIPGLAWIKDDAGRYVFINEAVHRVFGLTPEQVLGRTDAEIFPPETAQQFHENDERARLAERGWQTMETLRHPDGTWHHSVVNKFVVPTRSGRGAYVGGMAIDITERKEAEIALRQAHDRLEQHVRERTSELEQANARLQAMFDQGLFSGLIALDGTLIDVNRSWLEASGYQRGDVIGRPFWEAGWWGGGEVQAWIKIGFAEAVQGVRFRGDTVFFTVRGATRRMDLALVPIRGPDGAVTFVLPTGIDITERHRAEEELRAAAVSRESEARFRRMADSAPVLIWMADVQNLGTWFNQQWLDFVGRPLERELGTGWLENVHADDQERTVRARGAAVAARQPFEMEFRLRRHDGEYRWVLDHGVPTFGPSGIFTGYIGSCIDITERKQAEIAIRRLAAIVESSADAILAMDLDGFITSWNRGAELLYGYSATEAIGQPVNILVPPELRGEEDAILARTQRGSTIEHFETQRLRRDGTRLEVSISVSPLRDAGGQIIGISKIARDITGRKRTEAELRRREQLYRAIGESIDYGIWVSDAEGRNIYASDSFLRLLGLTQQEFAGADWTRNLHPDDAAGTGEAWHQCVRTGAFWEREHRYRGADGKWHPVLARGVPVRDEQGRITSWVGINLDISRLKEKEEALQRQTRNLAILNRVNSTLAAELDLERVVQVVVDASREVSGAAFGAFHFNPRTARAGDRGWFAVSGVGDEVARRIEAAAQAIPFDAAFAATGLVRINDIERDSRFARLAAPHRILAEHLPVRSYLALPLIARDSDVQGGLFFGHPDPDMFNEDAGHLLAAIVAQAAIAIENAQLYREVQRELREHLRAEAALRESEERFRTLADNIAQFAWTADERGRVTWFNRRWIEYTGITSEDGRDFDWASVHHPEHRQRVLEKYLRHVASGEVWEDTFPLRSRTGEYRWFLSRAVPIRDGEGRVVRWFGTNTDITAQREAELELQRARDEALAANRAKDDFLAALSHELRTPLNPVLLLASDAAENPALPAEVRADFDAIRKNVSLEARLIDDLLDLTRISRGKLQLDLGIHDVHELLHDALSTVRAEIEQKNLHLTLRLGATITRVRCDAVRVQQVFWNVLKNAVKFTPESGRITVETRMQPETGRIRITITDTGIGLDQDEQGRVFDVFWQGRGTTARAHQFGGLGLGLAISKSVIELHAGEIAISSPGRGQGVRVVIELPTLLPEPATVASPPAAPAVAEDPAPPVTGQPAGNGDHEPLRVLLVEDHAPTRATLARLLARRRFQVFAAANAREARQLAREGRYDLLISDVGLPDGNGHDLMREFGAQYGLPGIALTGFGMEGDIARSTAAGFSAHLTKPVNVNALDRAIAETVRRRS